MTEKAHILAMLIALAVSGCDDAVPIRGKMTADEIVLRIKASSLEPEISAIVDMQLASSAETEPYEIKPSGSRRFASDGTGGMFYMLPDERILLVDSEGSFGIVAADFRQFIAITTSLPSWRDALRFVGQADPGRAAQEWNSFVRRTGINKNLGGPWLYAPESYSVTTPATARQAIRTQFGAEVLADPFAALHNAVNRLSADVTVSQHGSPFLPFGRYS